MADGTDVVHGQMIRASAADRPMPNEHEITSIEIRGNLRAVVVCGECGGTSVLRDMLSACAWCPAQIMITTTAKPVNRRRDGTYPPNRYPRAASLQSPP